MLCLSGAKMNMRATFLKAAGSPELNLDEPGVGHWQYIQNPDSGAIEKFWIRDDVATPDVNEGYVPLENVPVIARGVLNAGLRNAGTMEVFDQVYTNTDWIKLQYPPSYNVTQRDQVTDITDAQGNLIWKNMSGEAETFNVMGITPVIGPFGRVTEYTALLKRAEVQS